MSTASEVLELLRRLDLALAVQMKLMAKRRDMIAAYQRTGQKVDQYDFAEVADSIQINEQTIAGLQSALKALGAGGGQ